MKKSNLSMNPTRIRRYEAYGLLNAELNDVLLTFVGTKINFDDRPKVFSNWIHRSHPHDSSLFFHVTDPDGI